MNNKRKEFLIIMMLWEKWVVYKFLSAGLKPPKNGMIQEASMKFDSDFQHNTKEKFHKMEAEYYEFKGEDLNSY